MPDPNWENLKDIFHAALALPPQQRADYLKHACTGYASLKKEVEALLTSHEETENFIDTPAYQAAAEMLIGNAELKPDQQIAHYKIVSRIGEGGMGVVYLAEDLKLHRRVALKFLSRALTQDQERLRRFEQEARAASALNHPNILTIHEFGEAEGHPFIATEFIEGQTLRERLHSDISISDALEITIQLASALVAAHRVNIVHRDIKPENVMIRDEDGLVKVLDFGLAKNAGEQPVAAGETVVASDGDLGISTTSPGVLMGTVAYMSPEQTRGKAVDARTDIWSLGVVLYEMLCDELPFTGNTANEIISAIGSKEPAALVTVDAPEELRRIVAKSLKKSKDERYSNSQQLLADLKSCKDSLRAAPAIERGDASSSGGFSGRTTQPAHITRASNSIPQQLATQFRTARGGAIAVATIMLLAIATGIAVYGWRAKHAGGTASLQIKSLAVLPFKSVGASDDYLGVGIADAVIRKIGQTGKLTVRPTSAVLKYAKDDVDSTKAARELGTDAILEGTVQRAGDRLRVTVNLLRVTDGASLYSDNFDLSTADVFVVQDKVAEQVAARLNIGFDAGQLARLNEKYTPNPKAYEAYIRGLATLDERGYGAVAMPEMLDTFEFFKRSIELDPKYPLSHAKLAFAYAWTAVFIEPDNSKWAELAREEIKQAQDLDSNLPEMHVAHAFLLWTAYEGYQNEAAIRELLLAKQVDPNTSTGDLPAILSHVGLDDLASRELERALQIDPTSPSLKDLKLILPYLRGDADAYLIERQRTAGAQARLAPWYYLRKGLLDEARKSIDDGLRNAPDDYNLMMEQALVLALKGSPPEAESKVPKILARISVNNNSRHHSTYDAACIYALAGNSSQAVKWLRETAATGFPNYPLFARDPFLNRIRQAPEFIQFMTEQKAQWEKYREEFGN